MNDDETSDSSWLLHLLIEWNRKNGHPTGEEGSEPLDTSAIPHFFERLRLASDRYQSGNIISLLDALQICRDNGLELPDWLLDAISGFMVATLTGSPLGQRGRSNNPIAKARVYLRKEKQRETVRRIRLAQRVSGEFMLFLALPDEAKAYIAKHGALELGENFKSAVEAAELCLRGTPAQGTFSTIERAAKEIPDSTFEVSEFEVREALGIDAEELPEPFGGFEVVPLSGFAGDDNGSGRSD